MDQHDFDEAQEHCRNSRYRTYVVTRLLWAAAISAAVIWLLVVRK